MSADDQGRPVTADCQALGGLLQPRHAVAVSSRASRVCGHGGRADGGGSADHLHLLERQETQVRTTALGCALWQIHVM